MSEYPEMPLESWPVASSSPEHTNGAVPHLSDEVLAAWVADELASDEHSARQQHLSVCTYCQNALREVQRIQTLGRAAASSIAPGKASVAVIDSVLAHLTNYAHVGATSPDLDRASAARAKRAPASAQGASAGARDNRRRAVWRRVGTLVAVLLLVASSAVLFSRLSLRSNPVFKPGIPGIANIPGNWAEVLPSGSLIIDVAVVSPTDIWAVGSVRTGAATVSLQMHFDGKYWHRSSDQFPLVLNSIAMDSADDGWACGTTLDGIPVLLHYSRGHWQYATSSLDTRTFKTPRMSLFKIRMASATSGWMLGQPVSTDHSTQVFQYLKVGNTYKWEPTESFGDTELAGLSVVSDHEVWMAGHTGQATGKNIIIRITATYADGTPNSTVTRWATHSWDVGDGTLTSVSMLSATDGWAAGGDEDGVGILFHWDGHQWNKKHFVPDGQEAATIDSIIMTGANTGWAFASSGEENYLYSTAHDQWFGYQVPEDRVIVTAAPVTPTTLLAITLRINDEHNYEPLPVTYEMANGKRLPTPTPWL